MFIKQNGIIFELDKKELTAKIVHSENIKNIVIIYDSIEYDSNEYIIKSIQEKAFKNSKAESLNFSENSYITSIPKETFAFSSIQQLYLPASIEKLEEGWCHEAPEFISITVSPNNKKFIFYDNNLLIGKNSEKDDKFEILYFVNRNSEEITIPPNIKQIKPYSFESCQKLKKISFSKNSELKTVDSFSISKSNQLEEIDFSNNFVEELKENWCNLTPKLKKVIISPKNKNFFNIGDKIIFGKSNERSKYFDTLCFISREVETAIIPSKIQHINPSSLSKLTQIKTIDIKEKNYQLQLFFEQLPQNYESNINNIQNEVIKNMYSKFSFRYYYFSDQKENDNENILFNLFFYLVNFKFITFSSSNENHIVIKQSEKNIPSKTNVIFCVEGLCIIVEQIEISQFDILIDCLKKHDVSLINVSIYGDEKEEIYHFCLNFSQEIKRNIFIKYTIQPIAGYLIRRFFYPTDFFIDKLFFIFDQENVSKENYLKQALNDYLINELEYGTLNKQSISLEKIAKEINKVCYKINGFYENKNQPEFYENDFVILRTIYTKDNLCFYYLAIYLPTFYIFMIEKFDDSINEIKGIEREINLYNKPHRCLTRIYGILKRKNNIIGIIYEFMSNGSLDSYLKNHKLKETFFLLIMSRVFQGIDFLHSKGLIHRDLKPGNILIDHDGLPYISDFETIRLSSSSEGTFTQDIGTSPFASPEQLSGGDISYPTDIYSFGQIIKYLLEKQKKDQINIIQMKTILFQDLINKCIKNSPRIRIKRQMINAILNEIIISFFHLEEFLLNENKKINSSEIINFIFENIYTQKIEVKLQTYKTHIQNFQNLYPLKIADNKSLLFYFLGLIYLKAEFVQIDFSKAKEYFEESAKFNNASALIYLGDIYRDGNEVEQDYIKAKEYYEKASKLNNSYALNNLGILYENGFGVKRDYFKAKEYYQQSSKLKNHFALLNLGNLYYLGLGVKQDYSMAKQYYEEAAKFGNSDAINNLGVMYEKGFGVTKNYLIAKELYEKSSRFNNSTALKNLGDLYKNGYGVRKDYIKAKELYEESSDFNNPEAINELGKLYQNGKGVQQDYITAIELYEKASRYKNSDALNNLGNIYKNGYGVKKDYIKAKEYYEKSSNLGNSNALNNLGNLYLNGEGVKQDYLKAKELYEEASKLNNSNSFVFLGYLYINGYGVKQNYTTAIELYEKASMFDNSFALNKLGNIYKRGLGVKKDYLKAKEYYEKSSNLGNSDALNNLGNLFLNGYGVKQNYLKAKKYYEEASKLNNSNAFIFLGYLYENGYGVKKDYFKAKELYEKALKLNNINALNDLGNLYENGFGVKQDYLKAKEFYEKAAKYDNSQGLFNLGYLYYFGNGVKQDFLKAFEYYEKSSRFNNVFAINNLGDLYENGYGVTQDYLKAKELYEKASELGNSTALNNLGHFYEKGIGVKQDYLKAKELYEKSSKLRNSNAFLYLGKLYEKGNGVKQDYLRAKEYYEKSSMLFNPASFYNLGHFYENGFGVKQDFFKAKEYYEKSSELNYSKAHFYLGDIYSDGYICQIDFNKAIRYYLKSIEIENGMKQFYNPITKSYTASFKTNNYRYISCNNLGLIYITEYENSEKAEEYLKESAFAEYPYGQNNFGLLNQLYLNKMGNAEYMFERSAKHCFSLAEFNIGQIKEHENKIKESIDFYIRASEHENNPLIYRDTKYKDKRLEISKKFIICFTNFKLVDYFISIKKYDEAKKYFSKSINSLKNMGNDSIYQFKFIFKNHNESKNDLFMYLKKYVLNFPLFNLKKQPKLKLEQYSFLFDQNNDNYFPKKPNENKIDDSCLDFKNENSFTNKENESALIDMKKNENVDSDKIVELVNNENIRLAINNLDIFKKENTKDSKNNFDFKNELLIFEDPDNLFDFIFNDSTSINNSNENTNRDLKSVFIKEIKEIIKILGNILYTSPYSILFGRISIEKSKTELYESSNTRKDVDQLFYDGFGL